MADSDPVQVEAWRAWCQERVRSVASRTGNLALVGYQPVSVLPVRIEQVPGTFALAKSGAGVVVRVDGNDGITVDGELVDGPVFVARLRPDGTPVIRSGRYSLDVFSLDGTDFELRIYDAEAANLDNFKIIDVYDYSPDLVVEGSFRPFAGTRQVPWDFTRSADSGHVKKVPGAIALAIGGTTYELLAFVDGDHIVLVFADETSGGESYAPGRFLRMPRPDAAGSVTLDFNRAFVPPCGFSDFYSCPVPPGQNRISAPIRAGEKKVLWREPRY